MEKLKCDTRRYLADYSLDSAFKLLFLIDFWPVFFFRTRDALAARNGFLSAFALRLLTLFRPMVDGLSGSRIEHGAKIGKGLLLHYSIGVVITSQAVIGDNCTIFSHACIVHKANKKGQGAPKIGNNVELGSGCKIVGKVTIGNGVSVGANAVVLTDVPDDSIAVGIPARHFPKDCNSRL